MKVVFCQFVTRALKDNSNSLIYELQVREREKERREIFVREEKGDGKTV